MSQALGSSTGECDEGVPTPVNPLPEDDPILPLVRKFQAGQDVDEIFTEIHTRFYRPLRSFFMNLGFSPEDAEDLTQTTFIRVLNGMEGFRGDARFGRWLFGIAANIYKNEVRRRRTEKRKALEISIEGMADQEDPSGKRAFEPVDPGPGVDEVLGDRERLAVLHAAFGELPPQMRHVCHLRFIEERKYREIAVLLKISIETVKAHLHQARRRLTAKLGEDFTGGAGLPEGQGSET
ncbi:MAG TPA: sigma-70 family RNA polymerase sigma factor [Thermoanaerobaculia bacterium]|nr:sigma-70 family RNA polymerase sigma factor [Thermoanaerobaculia bacterium]